MINQYPQWPCALASNSNIGFPSSCEINFWWRGQFTASKVQRVRDVHGLSVIIVSHYTTCVVCGNNSLKSLSIEYTYSTQLNSHSHHSSFSITYIVKHISHAIYTKTVNRFPYLVYRIQQSVSTETTHILHTYTIRTSVQHSCSLKHY